MNRRRELALQRVSRIGSLAAMEVAPQNTRFKGRPVGALTIEAVIDTYTQTSKDTNKQEKEQLSQQMTEYMSALEESRIANASSAEAKESAMKHLNIEKLEKVLADDPSARYQLNKYKTKDNETALTDFDRLDANRCSGFLLYSYNKRGVHSVLGETPSLS